MTVPPPKTDATEQTETEAPLTINFDAAEFFQFVDETGWSNEQKAEYITLVWNIVFDLVMSGITVNAPKAGEKACGQLPENSPDKRISAPSVVNSSHGRLIEKFTRLNPVKAGPSEKEVTDG